jgi:hypothetical protein
MNYTDQRPTLTAAGTVRAVTVPLLLIAAGALFLLDYSGGPGVRKTWPILLIGWGVAWAVLYSFSRQEKGPRVPES